LSAPCIKLPGPKTASRIAPSRPIPTAIDAVISSEEESLLAFAYSQQGTDLSQFIKIASVVYGASIQEYSLRHAILAWTASRLPLEQFGQRYTYHKEQVYCTLIRKLDRQATISEGDIFSAWVLAWTIHSSTNCVELTYHVNGFTCMLQSRLKQPRASHSGMITVFGPKLYADAIFFAMCHCLPATIEAPGRLFGFRSRVLFLSEVLQAGDKTHELWGWVDAIIATLDPAGLQAKELVGLFYTIGMLFRRSLLSLHTVARQLQTSETTNIHTQSILQYLETELHDLDLFHTLVRLANSVHGDEDERLVTCGFQVLETAQIIVSILQSPAIISTLKTSHLRTRAGMLISSPSSKGTLGPLSQMDPYLDHVLLLSAALALSPLRHSTCISFLQLPVANLLQFPLSLCHHTK